MHSRAQDEEQVRDHYDRGNDFYSWFLGERMVYTGGLIKDINKMETLEELQDNKMTMVCDKLDLKEGDRLLDIGCGWGTLVTHAAKNYGADVTGGKSLLDTFLRDTYVKSLLLGNKPHSVPSDCKRTTFPNLKVESSAMTSEMSQTDLDTTTRSLVSRWQNMSVSGDTPLSSRTSTTCSPMMVLWFSRLLVSGPTGNMRTLTGVSCKLTLIVSRDVKLMCSMNKYVFPGADASLPLGWVVSKVSLFVLL